MTPPPATRPTDATLRKYGMTRDDWDAVFARQGSVCGCCRKPSKSGLYAIDHEHVKGWKKMAPRHRRWFVRGVVCYHCNHRLLGQFMTPENARRVIDYLEAHDLRKGLL